MSWDVMIFNTRGKRPPSIEEFQQSDCDPLGPAASVRQRLSELLPGIDWSDTTWGMYEGHGLSIEFNVGKNDPIEHMTLGVRGRGDALVAIVTLARRLGWSAIDCSTDEFLDLESPSQAGWEGFQALRNRVVDQHRGEGAG